MTIMVTADHVREARARHGGYCTKGMRVWAERNGLDFRQFLTVGYPVEVMQSFDDEFMRRVVNIAREKQS